MLIKINEITNEYKKLLILYVLSLLKINKINTKRIS